MARKTQRKFSLYGFIVILLVITSAAIASNNKVVESNNEFGLQIFSRFKSDANACLSPFSIYSALGMVCAGANSSTASQMKSVMLIKQKDDEFHKSMKEALSQLSAAQETHGFQLNCANALWMEKTYRFLPSYTKQIKSNYFSGLMYLDFLGNPGGSVQTINNWVKEKTNLKIPHILSSLSRDTKLVVTNAIYFHADWKDCFPEGSTIYRSFFLNSQEDSIMVRMMNMKIDNLLYYENDFMQLVRIPYKGDAVEMVVILPKNNETLSSIDSIADYKTLQNWIDSAWACEVILSLPKFKIEYHFNLGAVLQAMGMTAPFSELTADFSLMDGSRNLKIDKALHKAIIEVDEKGTEAAAATAITIRYISKRPLPKNFNADRPFLFIIRDKKSNCFLFIGRLVNPKAG